MTGRLEIRYRRYVPYGPLLRVRAWLDTQRGRMVQASGKLALADDESVVFAEAQGTFMTLRQSRCLQTRIGRVSNNVGSHIQTNVLHAFNTGVNRPRGSGPAAAFKVKR